jgi:hypothetical protein
MNMNPVFYADTISPAGYKRQILHMEQKPSLLLPRRLNVFARAKH